MRARCVLFLTLALPCTAVSANYQLGDYDGDGQADMLLRSASGAFECSTTLAGESDSGFSSIENLPTDFDWFVAAQGDFDGDNKTDLTLRHSDDGWFFAPFDGCELKTERVGIQLNDRGLDVRVVAVTDFDGDQKDDLILRDDVGAWSIVFMDGNQVVKVIDNPTDLPKDTQWGVIGVGDFDGDDTIDVLVRHVDGSWQLHSPTDTSAAAFNTKSVPFQEGTNWRDEATADFDGDGQTDLLLRHADGTWEVQTLGDGDATDVDVWKPSHLPSDWSLRSRATGDLNGDGRAHLVLWDRDTGRWSRTELDRNDTSAGELYDLPRDADTERDWMLPRPPVYFPDLALRLVVEIALGRETGSWTSVRALAGVNGIYHNGPYSEPLPHKIVDLRGLRAAEGLTYITLERHAIETLVPLIGLSRVERLELLGNEIVDVGPLEGLIDLNYLHLSYNDIEDIYALNSLAKLENLGLGRNRIVDIGPLATLIELRDLDLSWNRIVDIGPLATLVELNYLNLWINDIEDISPLGSLTKLESLNLVGNEIVDLEPLVTLDELRYLELGWNDIEDTSPLGSLTKLESLNLAGNEIVDVGPLATLVELKSLFLQFNNIEDISALSTLTKLERLNLYDNRIVDIGSLATLVELTDLDLGLNDIQDISALSSLLKLESLNLDLNPLSDASQNQVIPALRERGVAVEFLPIHTFKDSRGRAAKWSFSEEQASQNANGVLVFFHGNNYGPANRIIARNKWYVARLAQENGLVDVVVASPESGVETEPWRAPDADGGGLRWWNYEEDVDLVHEMLQSDFGGKLKVDKDKVYLHGSSQGTCFLHQFFKRWGREYRGGMLADCGCIDGGLDPLLHTDPSVIENFRVFVRAPTGDFLHRPSRFAYNYYEFILGIDSHADLNARGGHCHPGDISDSDAMKWLTTGEGLQENTGSQPHFTRVSLADRIVGLATDSDGALWFVQQERTDDNPSASVWRSVDRGKSFEMTGRHALQVYDLDIAGDALFLTTSEGPIRRSKDQGRTFEELAIEPTTATGAFYAGRREVLGWPDLWKTPVLTSTKSGSLLLLPGRRGADASRILVSDDLGETWVSKTTPDRSDTSDNALGPDPVALDDDSWHLTLGDPVKWLAADSTLDWHEISLQERDMQSVAWDGVQLLGFSWTSDGQQEWWTASDPSSGWTEKVLSDEAADAIGNRGHRLTALDQGDVLLFGAGSEGHLYNSHSSAWTHVNGGQSLNWIKHKVAVDAVRGDVFVTDSRAIFRLDSLFREGADDLVAMDDRDGDTVPDRLDAFPDVGSEYMDSDRDGVGNAADSDDDGDGVLDGDDAAPLDAGEVDDHDGDGLGDRADNDKDGDGVVDDFDWLPLNANEIDDTDGDGLGDWEDLDDDNDGVADADDAFPRYQHEFADSDGDLIGDAMDPDPDLSTMDSPTHLSIADGVWWRAEYQLIVLDKSRASAVTYPRRGGDIQFYGRLNLGDQPSTVLEIMLAVLDGRQIQLLYLDRNGDLDLTNDGPPQRVRNGYSVANWHEAWVSVSYQSGVSLPYRLNTPLRVEVSSNGDVAYLSYRDSGRATRITLPEGPSVSLAVIDGNGNAVFTDEDDYICVDANHDLNFEGCGRGGAEQFAYGENVVVDDIEYKIETVPSGYTVSIERVGEAAETFSHAESQPNPTWKESVPVVDEREIRPDWFYSPSRERQPYEHHP